MVTTALVALALLLVSNPVAAESRFLFDSTGHSATVVEPSPQGPAIYFDNRGNIGTIQRPLPKGPIFHDLQNSPGPAIDSQASINRRFPTCLWRAPRAERAHASDAVHDAVWDAAVRKT